MKVSQNNLLQLAFYSFLSITLVNCSSYLDEAKVIINKKCLLQKSTNIEGVYQPIESCKKYSPRIKHINDLVQKNISSIHIIDGLIRYLENNPDSQEAPELLNALILEYVEILVVQFDQAIRQGDQLQIWRLSKEFDFIKEQRKIKDSIPEWITEYIDQSKQISEAIEITEVVLANIEVPRNPEDYLNYSSDQYEVSLLKDQKIHEMVPFYQNYLKIKNCIGNSVKVGDNKHCLNDIAKVFYPLQFGKR